MKKLIPADTVDLDGNVWETTGENIRHGVKGFYESEVKAIIDIMFPVGSVYCGENAFVLSVGTWSLISEQAKQFIAAKKTRLAAHQSLLLFHPGILRKQACTRSDYGNVYHSEVMYVIRKS